LQGKIAPITLEVAFSRTCEDGAQEVEKIS
jgi:hypothetical protein